MLRPIVAGLMATIPALGPGAESASAQVSEIGYEERFALAEDRAAAIAELIPGSEEFYFFSALHAQSVGRLDEVDVLMRAWRDRHGVTGRYDEIETRQALLRYGEAPADTFRYIVDEFGIRFGHTREVIGEKPDLPTALDPEFVSYDAFLADVLRRNAQAIRFVRDRGLESFVGRELSIRQTRDLLGRLQRPDVPGLVALVVDELEDERSRGFGSLGIHDRLLLDQLEECAARRPQLMGDRAWVNAVLKRLAPSADERADDVDVRRAHLERLEAFAWRLPASYDSLRAHVLYHRLHLERDAGNYDRERFDRYLRLPRRLGYVEPEYLRRREPVNLGEDWGTGLGAVRDDERLVREHFAHFFVRDESYERYAELVRRDVLERIFAESKILAGVGDMERWYSLLDDPSYYERLKDRVEILFPRSQERQFGPNEAVAIDVELKNVETLLVKVFEIDTLGHFEGQRAAGERLSEVDASIELDGLVAHEEFTRTYEQPPLRRHRARFEFPRLEKPGVYVVEFIGNGISSRAVIRKGTLTHVVRTTSAGHAFQVLDGNGNALADASILFAGREFESDDDGVISVPFTTEPGTKQVVLRHGDRGVLETFRHEDEEYALDAPVLMDRETLIAGATAPIVVRPRLTVSGVNAPLELLEDVKLHIRSTDLDGVESTQVVDDLELEPGRDLRHEIQVPPRTASVQVHLTARVRNVSVAEDQNLNSGRATFQVNGIDRTDGIASALLTRMPAGYAIDVLGKNGEPLADVALQLTFAHEMFTTERRLSLKTDAGGRVFLGRLPGVAWVSASGSMGEDRWVLEPTYRSGHTNALFGVRGQVLRVPYEGAADQVGRDVASFLELRSGAPTFDHFDKVSLTGGFIELRGVEPGDYHLTLEESGERFDVRVTEGDRFGPYAPRAVSGAARRLELVDSTPVQIGGAVIQEDELVVRALNADEGTRLAVVATRYEPGFDVHRRLELGARRFPTWEVLPRIESVFAAGREIGDEYRYILDRRMGDRYPGNMLARAGLLLNVWALQESTRDVLGIGGGAGGKFGGRLGGKRNLRAAGGAANEAGGQAGRGSSWSNLDFLTMPSAVLTNLVPDENGFVRIPVAELGEGHIVTVVLMDEAVTLSRTYVRSEEPRTRRDVRLVDGLDPESHVVEERRIDYVAPGESVRIADAANAGAQTFDTLEDVFRLLTTRVGDSQLERFDFLVRWPSMTDEERLDKYADFACHELHVFLKRKDPAFFEAVVRPYIANKLEPAFMDRWLLDRDLTDYLDPWAFAQLNVVERILLLRGLDGDAARHVRDLVALIPPDRFEPSTYFEITLATGGLDKDAGLADKLGEVREEMRRKSRGRDRSVPQGGAGGGGGPATPGPAGPSSPGAPARARAGLESLELAADEAPNESARWEEADEDLEEEAKSDDFFLSTAEKELQQRQQHRAFFRDVDDTQELAERRYWRIAKSVESAGLVGANPFWADLAASDPTAPFVSAKFPLAGGSRTEALLALAFLDLPFEAEDADIQADGRSVTLRAGSGLFLVRKELTPAEAASDTAPVLIGQDFFKLDEPFYEEDGRRRDRFVTSGFVRGVPYGCRVVVTNPSSAPIDVDVLLQIPAGALPVRGGFVTKGIDVRLDGYQSRSLEYAFYFPSAGSFGHYPVHVGESGSLLGCADPFTFDVLDEPAEVDTASWRHVSQMGDESAVFSYLEGANLGRVDLSKIAWRMRDREWYERTIGYLRGRHAYDATLWSYSMLHQDERTAREFLRHRGDVTGRLGAFFESPLASVDPEERGQFEFLEYDPLVNGRAHQLGDSRKILNASFGRQYARFLRKAIYMPELNASTRLEAAYYLSLQDRVGDALRFFGSVEREDVATKLQYDYMQAYFAFYTGEVDVARRVAMGYLDHPVERWRGRFQNVVAQLDEAAGGALAGIQDPDDRDSTQGQLAATEPVLDLDVEARRVALTYENVDSAEVSYREMDIELLFSTNPFLGADSGSFGAVKPNLAQTVALPAGGRTHAFDLPPEFQSSNVLVEVRAGGVVRRETYFAGDLDVQTFENYGQLRVRGASDGQPLPATYVKVYARLADGTVRFHKDGYTDLRGRFDYVSLSGMDDARIERFAVLVAHDDRGAEVRELAPPAR